MELTMLASLESLEICLLTQGHPKGANRAKTQQSTLLKGGGSIFFKMTTPELFYLLSAANKIKEQWQTLNNHFDLFAHMERKQMHGVF